MGEGSCACHVLKKSTHKGRSCPFDVCRGLCDGAGNRIQLVLEHDERIIRRKILSHLGLSGLSAGTEVKYNGTAYYISNSGNDSNNGLTPETAWATLKRANAAPLRKGDAVFLERGGIWREHLICKPHVVYSAYGSGMKPVITLSPENGADKEKWSLYGETEDGGKIWRYHIPMEDISVIVFNAGKSWAIKKAPYWNGKEFMTRYDSKQVFDILLHLDENLSFFSPGSSAFTDNPNSCRSFPVTPGRNIRTAFLPLVV